MIHQATWNDPFVTWADHRYTWEGIPVDEENREARLRQSSVFAHITEQAPVARITQQRLYARVADGH
jgi:hypothetical protein